MNRLSIFLLVIMVACLIGDSGVRHGAKYLTCGLSRVDICSELEYSKVSTEIVRIDDELERFREEVGSLVEGETDDFEKALIIKEWVMNQASRVGLGIKNTTPYEVLSAMRQGEAASCGNMALVYLATLKSVGIEARLVQLMRGIYSNLDTHMVVEVLVDGGWVVIDPNFNCYFVVDGASCSASDLQQLSQRNENPKRFEVVYGKAVSYPVELNAYPLDPLMFYNNVFTVKRLNYSRLIIPTLHYYYGSSYAVEAKGGIQDSSLRVEQWLVVAWAFVFPVGLVASGVALAVIFLARLRRKPLP